MGYTIAQKIIKAHMLSGDMTVGSEVALKIDPDTDAGRYGHNGIP